MVPLLEIKTVPIEIQVKTKNASLEFTRGTAEMEVSRSEQGDVNVKSRPIQVKLDTFEPRQASAPVRPTPAPTPAEAATPAPAPTPATMPALVQAPASTAYEATSAYADQGQLMLNARIGTTAAAQTVQQSAQQTGQNTEWDGSMEIRYEMDKLNFDWKIERGEFKFTPGDIKFTVKQRPDVIIKYTGGPIYVPRSSDPNYKPVDVQA
jgi:hypothetical protein